jgi:hypothetical protein
MKKLYSPDYRKNLKIIDIIEAELAALAAFVPVNY